MHLEYNIGVDSSLPVNEFWLRPVTDPLDLLTPSGDAAKPRVVEIHFKSGEPPTDKTGDSYGDGVGGGNGVEIPSATHCYFSSVDYDGKLVVGRLAPTRSLTGGNQDLTGTDRIDIVGQAYDYFGVASTADGTRLGIKRIEILGVAKQVGRTVPTTVSFDFTGEFAPAGVPNGKQDNGTLIDQWLVRTAYTVSAKFHRVAGNADFFYTLSNVDDDRKVEASDKSLAWATTAVRGSRWSDTAAEQAANNAQSNYPDDYYDFFVTAYDAAENSGLKQRRVLLDNWKQEINLIFDYTEPIGVHLAKPTVTGSQFTKNSSVMFYKLYAPPVAGQKLDPDDAIGSTTTTADGTLSPNSKLEYLHTSNAWIVADYHGGDGIYQPQLDAVTYHSFSYLADPQLAAPTAERSAAVAYHAPSGPSQQVSTGTPAGPIARPTRVVIAAPDSVARSAVPPPTARFVTVV